MRSRLYTYLIATILYSLAYAQSNVPELTASSAIGEIAVLKGRTVVLVPMDEYRLDNVRMELLMNRLEECAETDSVQLLRLANKDSIIIRLDRVAANQDKILLAKSDELVDMHYALQEEKRKKRRWMAVAVAELVVLAGFISL